MPADVVIRSVQPEDYPAIFALTRESFSVAASIDARIEALLGGVAWQAIKIERVRQELHANPGACAVALSAGVVVGYVTTVIDRIAQRGTIANVAVAASFQGRGIGRRLIRWALDRFREDGLRQAKIETLATNAAGQRLYPAVGFREVARQIHYAMDLSVAPEAERGMDC